jgi:hypothetical protein
LPALKRIDPAIPANLPYHKIRSAKSRIPGRVDEVTEYWADVADWHNGEGLLEASSNFPCRIGKSYITAAPCLSP